MANTAACRVERAALVVATLGATMVFMDATALNVALPAVQRDLEATGPELLWIVNAYTLPLAGLLLVGGALADRRSRRGIHVAGIAVFEAASVGCVLASSPSLLIAARALQGVGAALMVPSGLAILAAAVPASRRGRAIGTWSACSVISTAAGLLAGGLLAHADLWRAIFLLNLPLGAAAVLVLGRVIPEGRSPGRAARLDYPGASLATLGLSAVSYGGIEAASRGLADPGVRGWLGAGMAMLLGFVLVEARTPAPLLPLALFRVRRFASACLGALGLYTGLYAVLTFLPLNLVQIQGYDAATAGVVQLPLIAALAVSATWAGRLADRHGLRVPLMVGSAVTGLGFWLLALPGVTAGPRSFWTSYLVPLLVLGVGMGISMTALSATLLGVVAPDRLGLAAGINGTLSRVAGVLAIVILGAIALASFQRALERRAAALGVTPETRAALSRAAIRLGDTRPPAGAGTAERAAVDQATRLAFVDAFRLLARIAAGLAWTVTVLAGVLRDGPPLAPARPPS